MSTRSAPILPLYQVCSGDDFRRLLKAYCPECLSPRRSINIRSARLRSFTRIQAELLRWQQHQYNVVGACIVPPFVWISPAPPLAPSINCSTPRPFYNLPQFVFTTVGFIYLLYSISQFQNYITGYVNEQVNMRGWLIQLEYIIFHFIVNTH